ncbi:MAG: DUF1819 family protein [Bacteroidales bacterium]|nr:DUF1819 family protein [Bacteroidales bacterium]
MRILPLLMNENSDRLLKEEISNNNLFQVNSQKARERFAAELRRRYNAVPYRFWEQLTTLSESGQKVGLLYSILRAYKLIFDFHFNVTVKHWNSIDRTLVKSDLMMEFNELSAKDPFVDSWTDNTKNRCASQYLTILRQVGMLDSETDELRSVKLDPSEYDYYIRSGEEWFLEASLLYPYEITEIKSKLL